MGTTRTSTSPFIEAPSRLRLLDAKEQCKKYGWMELTREDGSTFKNQGDCVSYTNTGR